MSSLRTEEDPSARQRPVKRATIALEEGETDSSLEKMETGKSSGGSASANDEEKGNGRRRSTARDENDAADGQVGTSLGPARRTTMNTDPAEGRALVRSFTSLFVPEHRLKPAPSVKQSIWNVVKYNYLNILLVLIPISWALHFSLDLSKASSSMAIFLTAFLAIMPLAGLLSYGTEEIAMRVGQTLGGLLNATLGNAVELIVAIIALFQCELTITQTSLVGSVLSNLLLVLGMCFFVGGLRYKEQEFKQTAAQLNTGMLAMAVISVLVPASFHATLGNDIPDIYERPDLLKMSRGSSIILLLIYIGYLWFQLRSHAFLYVDDDPGEEEPTLHVWVAGGVLVLSTVLVGVTSEWLVDSLDGFSVHYGVNKTFIGLVLLPIVSNAAEHVTAVLAARRNAVDLAMGVAVGSSIQIALFVLPLLVVIGWIADKPMSLLFDPFVSILMFLAVLIVSYALADGRSNYMEGYILMNVFVLMSLAAWFVPTVETLFTDLYCKNPEAQILATQTAAASIATATAAAI